LVQKVSEKWESKSGKKFRSPLHSVCIDDEWYGFGFDDPKIQEGQVVSFDFAVGKFGNDGDAGTVTLEAEGSPVTKTAQTKSDDRQTSIVYQSQHRDALEAVKFMIEQGMVKVPAKQSDKYDVFVELVRDLTVQWTKEALSPDLSESAVDYVPEEDDE
jgi:hypothetical protein